MNEFRILSLEMYVASTSGIYQHSCELQQLSLCEESLPGAANLQQAQSIIRVHHYMDPRIEQRSEISVTTRPGIECKPPCPCDCYVVVHMQEGNLQNDGSE
jgi:hypothetical protein